MSTQIVSPRLFFTKASRCVVSRFPGLGTRHFVRDHLRKWCVDEDLPVYTRWGFNIGASPHDYASAGIFFFGDYDPEMTSVMQHHIRPGQHVWDLGTERGWFTLLMASLVGPQGRVDAFEALPGNAAKVRRNCQTNGYDWVHVHAQAVTDQLGVGSFVPPSDEVTNHTAFLHHCSGVGYLTAEVRPGTLNVPTTTLDDFARATGTSALHFLKMDIEGAEYKALCGGRRVLERFRPMLAIEYNRLTAQRAGTTVKQIYDLVADLRYDQFTFTRHFEPFDLARFDQIPDEAAITNVYCFPRPVRAL